jgi:hypothetical protein
MPALLNPASDRRFIGDRALIPEAGRVQTEPDPLPDQAGPVFPRGDVARRAGFPDLVTPPASFA